MLGYVCMEGGRGGRGREEFDLISPNFAFLSLFICLCYVQYIIIHTYMNKGMVCLFVY